MQICWKSISGRGPQMKECLGSLSNREEASGAGARQAWRKVVER